MNNNKNNNNNTIEFNKLTSDNFAARLKETNLPSKSDIANL